MKDRSVHVVELGSGAGSIPFNPHDEQAELKRRSREESGPVTVSYIPRRVDIDRAVGLFTDWELFVAGAIADGVSTDHIPAMKRAVRRVAEKLTWAGLTDRKGQWLTEDARQSVSEAARRRDLLAVMSPGVLGVARHMVRQASDRKIVEIPTSGNLGGYGSGLMALRILRTAGLLAFGHNGTHGVFVRLLVPRELALELLGGDGDERTYE